MTGAVLGISAYYHDSAAALLVDGRLVAAAQEERFTRRRHDAAFPTRACRYVLDAAGIEDDLFAIAFYEKPLLKFERLLETYHAGAPRGVFSFVEAMTEWLGGKLFVRHTLRRELAAVGITKGRLLFPEHHVSHAASAFFPSPFGEAAILTIDGVGEWATTMIGVGSGADIEIVSELHFPHSVGLLYSAFTYYLGFRVNSGEYKLMGLAPYGHADSAQTRSFRRTILDELVDVRPDGSILLNLEAFGFLTGLRMVQDYVWERLFGVARRSPESAITQAHMNLAMAIQEVTEEIVTRLARTARRSTNCRSLVMAGGVALNCVANGRIQREGIFDRLWVQPAAGDAGGALGAAQAAWHVYLGGARASGGEDGDDAMDGALLGPDYSDRDIENALRRAGAVWRRVTNWSELLCDVAHRLDSGQAGGWFQGRMEFGPRALGNRTIIADPRRQEMQRRLNLKTKFREGFRPFAPAVREEDVDDYFELDCPSPYMLLVAPVRQERQRPVPNNYSELPLHERLGVPRSDLPAVTHVDGTARVQTVRRSTNPRFWELLEAFKAVTGCGVLINTSFNVRGEPIVCSPTDAYRCFMATDLDFLVIGNYLVEAASQPTVDGQQGHRSFEPD